MFTFKISPIYFWVSHLTPSTPFPDKEEKLTWFFIFTLLCGTSKGFMKVLPFATPQRSVKIQIFILLQLSEMHGTSRVNRTWPDCLLIHERYGTDCVESVTLFDTEQNITIIDVSKWRFCLQLSTWYWFCLGLEKFEGFWDHMS